MFRWDEPEPPSTHWDEAHRVSHGLPSRFPRGQSPAAVTHTSSNRTVASSSYSPIRPCRYGG